MILVLLGVLNGLTPDPETRVEVPIPDGADADVAVVARIRGGRLELDVIGVASNPEHKRS